MSRAGLCLLAALAFGIALVAAGGDGSIVGDAGGAVLVVIGPFALGLGLVGALTTYVGPIERARRGGPHDESSYGVEALALSVAAGLALLALLALLLNTLGIDLNASGLRWWLAGADAVCVGLGWGATMDHDVVPAWAEWRSVTIAALTSVLLLGGALALGIVITRPPRPAHAVVGYTVLGLTRAGPDGIAVQVQNLERRTEAYRWTLSAGGARLPGGRFTLRAGEVWERRLDLAPYGGGKAAVQVSVYVPSASRKPYRSAYLKSGTP